MENVITESSRPEKVSPPATPAPDPVDESLRNDSFPGNEEETKQLLIEGGGKGKEKAKKEEDSADGKKRRKKRQHRSKEGEGGDEGSANKGKKRHRHKKRSKEGSGEDVPRNEAEKIDESDNVNLLPDRNNIDKNPYQPTVEYAGNGIESTTINIEKKEELNVEEEEVEIREINEPMIKQYTIFAIISAVCCFFPVGIPAIHYALQSRSDFTAGNEQRAYELIKKSKLFSQIAAVVGFLIYVLAAVLMMVKLMG